MTKCQTKIIQHHSSIFYCKIFHNNIYNSILLHYNFFSVLNLFFFYFANFILCSHQYKKMDGKRNILQNNRKENLYRQINILCLSYTVLYIRCRRYYIGRYLYSIASTKTYSFYIWGYTYVRYIQRQINSESKRTIYAVRFFNLYKFNKVIRQYLTCTN